MILLIKISSLCCISLILSIQSFLIDSVDATKVMDSSSFCSCWNVIGYPTAILQGDISLLKVEGLFEGIVWNELEDILLYIFVVVDGDEDKEEE